MMTMWIVEFYFGIPFGMTTGAGALVAVVYGRFHR